MSFEIDKLKYTGKIKEVGFGAKGDVIVGGEDSYPFYMFEGNEGAGVKIAMEVYDRVEDDWAPAAVAPFADVINDPVAWALSNVSKYGADMIALQLAGTDPNGANVGAEEAAALARKVADAVSVPVIVYGSGNVEKDADVLKKVAEACEGRNVLIGPVQEGDFRQIAASCIGYKQLVAATTPIDINLAKQLNILLENLGVSADRMVIDPTTGGLGYGLEYTYSIMERIRIAALVQMDDQLRRPIICDLGKEAWKCKEARGADPDVKFGDPARRGIMIEAVTAVLLLLAGADILVMRHPDSVALVRKYVDLMMN